MKVDDIIVYNGFRGRVAWFDRETGHFGLEFLDKQMTKKGEGWRWLPFGFRFCLKPIVSFGRISKDKRPFALRWRQRERRSDQRVDVLLGNTGMIETEGDDESGASVDQ